MIKAEEEIVMFKKIESLAKGFSRRLFLEKLEFTSDHEKVLRDYLRENLQLFCAEHKDNLAVIGGDMSKARDHFDYQTVTKLAQKLSIFGEGFVKSNEEKHPVLPIYRQEKYAILVKL